MGFFEQPYLGCGILLLYVGVNHIPTPFLVESSIFTRLLINLIISAYQIKDITANLPFLTDHIKYYNITFQSIF